MLLQLLFVFSMRFLHPHFSSTLFPEDEQEEEREYGIKCKKSFYYEWKKLVAF
jgi:hypothetical protein